jgi:hypothetical protein
MMAVIKRDHATGETVYQLQGYTAPREAGWLF